MARGQSSTKDLLDCLPYEDYKIACQYSKEQCDILAKLADITVKYGDKNSPGKSLMHTLNKQGFTVSKFYKLRNTMLNWRTTYYKPAAKIAILIGNDSYLYQTRILSPLTDCELVAKCLRKTGFITIIIKNTTSEQLRNMITSVLSVVPEDSYCFIFYAGHGCEVCNTKCILGIDCPTVNLELDLCVTENWLLRECSKCKPALCVLILDMCRNTLDRNENKPIFDAISSVESYQIDNNLLVCYSTGMAQTAYELMQMYCSKSINNELTYEIQTKDLDIIIPEASQYVKALCNRLLDNLDINSLLDKVHEDAEKFERKQRPMKIQCGVSKRSLYDVAKGDQTDLSNKLKDITEKYKEQCCVQFGQC